MLPQTRRLRIQNFPVEENERGPWAFIEIFNFSSLPLVLINAYNCDSSSSRVLGCLHVGFDCTGVSLQCCKRVGYYSCNYVQFCKLCFGLRLFVISCIKSRGGVEVLVESSTA